MRRLALAAALLAGCAELPDVAEGECGNGVVELGLGEECDGVDGCGASDTENACKLVCDDASAGCPDGWACGADQRCRHPTETFMATSVTTMPTAGVSVRDLDGDGAADLMGYDSRGLLTRFGDWDGAMADATRVPMPYNDSGSITPDVDGDGALDLAVPLPDAGWALFVNDGARNLVPAAQSAIELDFPGACYAITIGAPRTTPAGKPDMVAVIGGYAIGMLDGEDCSGSPDCILSPAGGGVVDEAIRAADLGYGAPDGVSDGEQFTAAVIGNATVSVWGRDALAYKPKRLGTWALPEPIAQNGHIAFVQMRGPNACTDLVVDTGSTIAVVFGEGTWPNCTGLSPQLGQAIGFGHPNGEIIGSGNVIGKAGLLVAENPLIDPPEGGPSFGTIVAAYVLNDTNSALDSFPLFGTDGYPHAAVVVDYNRDGYPDVAVAQDGTGTLDFYLNYQLQGFNAFPVDLGGDARVPVVGDFDGDLFEDVVTAVVDPTNPLGRDRLYIIYGDPSGHPQAAQFLGDFVATARPTPVSGGVQELTQSLVVSSNKLDEDDCDRRLAILIGNTSRQLISPYVLLHDGDNGPVGLSPQGMFDVSSPGSPQVLAMGTYVDGIGDTHLIGELLGFDGTSYTKLGVSAEVPETALPYWYLSGARWRPGDLDGDGVTDGIAIAYEKMAVMTRGSGQLVPDIQNLPTAMQYPPWFDLADMDGDDDLDLVGVSSGVDGSPANNVWVVPNDGASFDPAAGTTLTSIDGLYCYDMAVIRSNDSGVPQLLGACYRMDATDQFSAVLALATFDPEAADGHLTATRILPLSVESQSVEVGDFTGDGLDDIAVLGSQSMTLYRQCRDDELCEAFAAP